MKILFIALMMLVGTWCMAEDEEYNSRTSNQLKYTPTRYTPIQVPMPKTTYYQDSYSQVGNTTYHNGYSTEWSTDNN